MVLIKPVTVRRQVETALFLQKMSCIGQVGTEGDTCPVNLLVHLPIPLIAGINDSCSDPTTAILERLLVIPTAENIIESSERHRPLTSHPR